jgi:hypothetical protein
MDATIPPHAVLKSYGSRGVYTSKIKTADKAVDCMGKVTGAFCAPLMIRRRRLQLNCYRSFFIAGYTPSEYVPRYKTESKRDCYKGKQMQVSFSSKGFGKLEYNPSPYEDKSEKKKEGKLGFCTSKPFGRDDVANMLDTLRYRNALEKEAKFTKLAAEQAAKELEATHLSASPREGEAPASPGLNDSMRSTASAPAGMTSPLSASKTLGISGRLPQFTNGFDRQRHVPEFKPKIEYAERYDRQYGSLGTTNQAFGEGCAALSALDPPASPKRNFLKAFADKNHLVSPMIAGQRKVD